MLHWFDQNPDRYWWTVCGAVAAVLFLMLRPMLRPEWKDERRTDWRWSWVILGVLAVARWPTWFVTRQLNPDENQFIAGALTLRHDPVFWRSVDGISSGPLNYYALLPVGWLHGADDYGSARLTAFLLLAAALILVHQACALLAGATTARIAGFVTLCLEALTIQNDLLSYSSELVSACLLGAVVYLATRRLIAGRAAWPGNFVGGLAIAALPLAKLQTVPPAVVLAVGWGIGECRRRRVAHGTDGSGGRALVAGLATPVIATAAALTVFGVWRDMTISYLANNFAYVRAIYFPLGRILSLSWHAAIALDAMLPLWLAGAGLPVVAALAWLRPARTAWQPLTGAVVLCGATLACVLLPQRPFLHYWQLLIVPGTLLSAIALHAVRQRLESAGPWAAPAWLLSVLLLGSGGLLYDRARVTLPCVGHLADYQAHPMGRVAQLLRTYARPGESLGVWGWMANFYAEAGLRQATREAFSHMQILDNPNYAYYRHRYLADLEHSQPPVFVDAIGPVPLSVPAELLRHDRIFPELAAYIRRRYTRVAEIDGVIIYVRNDRLRPPR